MYKKTKAFGLTLAAGLLLGSAAHADVKVGFSGALSGPAAALGQDQYDGFMLAIEQLGGKLGGQPVTVIKEDDQLKPEIGAQIMRKFVQRDKVDVVVGLGFSNVMMASLAELVRSGTPAIATNGGPSPVAGERCAANIFSAAWQNDGPNEAAGQYATEQGYKSVYLMAPNYQAGKDMLEGFKRYYKGEIAGEVYTQVGQTDYSAEIAQMQLAGADALFVFYPGGMGVNFVKQLSQTGLLGKIPFLSAFTVDGATLPALKTSAAGAIVGSLWETTLDNPVNKEFVQAYEQKYGREPSVYSAVAYDTARILDIAVAKVDGKVSDKKAFAAAIKAAGAEVDSVRGEFSFGNNNMPVQNYYAFEMTEQQGWIVPKLLTTPLKAHRDAYHGQCSLK